MEVDVMGVGWIWIRGAKSGGGEGLGCITAKEIVRAYLPVTKVTPISELIYAVDRSALVASRLQGESAKPYAIAGYR